MGAMELLSVAGDEGNGVSLVNEMDYIFHLMYRPLQLLSQPLYNCSIWTRSLLVVSFSLAEKSAKSPGQTCNPGIQILQILRIFKFLFSSWDIPAPPADIPYGTRFKGPLRAPR